MLIMHGYGPAVWEMQFLQKLAPYFKIYVPIHPAFAGTPLPDKFSSIHDLVFLYLDFLDKLNLRKVTLMGFSMGGWVAAELATMNTSHLTKLLLVDSVGIKVGSREDRDIADVFALSDEKLARLTFYNPNIELYPPSLSNKELAIFASDRNALGVYTWDPYMHNPKLKNRLHRINIPTHFIWGKQDGIVSIDYGRKFCELITNSTISTIDQAGHIPHFEQPDVFSECVLKLTK